MSGMRRQPQGAIRLNQSNPLARGLAFAYVAAPNNTFIGYTWQGSLGVTDNAPLDSLYRPTPIGNGKASKTSAAYVARLNIAAMASSAYSLFAVGATAPSSGTIQAIDDDDGATRKFQFRLNNNAVELITFVGGTPYFATQPVALTSAQLAAGFTMGASISPAAIASYQNGAKTQTAVANSNAPTGIFNVGSSKAGSSYWTNGGIALVAGWTRALTDDEQRSLAANPWQLFESADDEDFAVVSSGTQIELASGSIALTGLTPSVAQTASTNVAPAAAAVLLTGYSPAISQSASQSIQSVPATLAVSGYAPQLSQTANQAMSPLGGALTLASYPPSVAQTAGTTVLPQPCSVALAGMAPVVAQTANVAVAPAAGSIAIVGYAPQITQIGSIAVSPAAGAVSIVGYEPTVLQGGKGAPGYGSGSQKRKYVVRKGDQLHVFTDAAIAQQFLHADDEPPPKQYPAKKQSKQAPQPAPKTAPVPEQQVELAEVRTLAARMHAEAEYQQLMAQRRYDAMLILLERLKDEEEDDWLLMAAS